MTNRAAPGGNRHRHSVACRNLQPSPQSITMIISRNMRSTSHLKHMSRPQIYGVSCLKESVGSIILKWNHLFRIWVQHVNDLFLYFVDRTSRYKFLEITNLTHFFTYLFIYFMSLHVSCVTALIIRRSNFINTSSGMISRCKWLLGMPVRRELLTGIPSSHLHRLIIPDDVLIQFDLLMMSNVTLKHVETWNK